MEEWQRRQKHWDDARKTRETLVNFDRDVFLENFKKLGHTKAQFDFCDCKTPKST